MGKKSGGSKGSMSHGKDNSLGSKSSIKQRKAPDFTLRPAKGGRGGPIGK